jgi:hypothetical protein
VCAYIKKAKRERNKKEMSMMRVVDDVQTLSRGYEFLPSSYFLPCCCYSSVHQRYELMNEAKKQKMKKKRNGNEPRLMMMVVLGSEGERNATLRRCLTIEKENELNDVVVRIFY